MVGALWGHLLIRTAEGLPHESSKAIFCFRVVRDSPGPQSASVSFLLYLGTGSREDSNGTKLSS